MNIDTKEKKDRLIVILGPTAVGKTALSIALAKELGTEIISGDSMLVYKGFDIGSAKPSQEEQEGVPHHLIDIREPWENYGVTDFVSEAAHCIREINARGKVPILAGGTGLYVKALLEGYEFNDTDGHEEYRAYLEDLGRKKGKEYVHSLLSEVDPQSAERLHVNDFRRVIRALEVQHFGGEQISQRRQAGNGELSREELCYETIVIGLERDRQELYERINRRVELMFEAGLEDEVRRLLEGGLARDTQAMKGIGYKETASYLSGEMSREEAIELIQKSTRHFAKRQLTWYRKMPYIEWLAADQPVGELLKNCHEKMKEIWGA
ncbi:tRNA (adenosine(37)-N6)-dimethylallyltransferase MiaA [Selenomonas sp. KH1T6]|uniref:tRNA (adenosine(37)-N6)-dimethylallyltransferase MiaA n=1 Tax=Selenomonas sp. KH1T6 TaxID=3158784 RepID=UPI0008A74288|nr:tRNA dimethylallyltransferase [Selenomonas ruminantium]